MVTRLVYKRLNETKKTEKKSTYKPHYTPQKVYKFPLTKMS